MSSETKQGWEPSAYVAEKFCEAFYGENWKVLSPTGEVRNIYIAEATTGLVAAVQADPLLSAAKDMQDALDQLLDDMEEDGLCVCKAAKDMALAALRKSRGEV